jgi:hypothetical protein
LIYVNSGKVTKSIKIIAHDLIVDTISAHKLASLTHVFFCHTLLNGKGWQKIVHNISMACLLVQKSIFCKNQGLPNLEGFGTEFASPVVAVTHC